MRRAPGNMRPGRESSDLSSCKVVHLEKHTKEQVKER